MISLVRHYSRQPARRGAGWGYVGDFRRLVGLFTLPVLFLLLATPVRADDASDLLARVVERYGQSRSAVIQFKEEGGSSIRGTLTTKGTEKYRLELPDRVVVCDGATVWNYSPSTHIVTIDKVRKSTRTLSPEFFIARVPRDAHASLGKSPSESKRLLVLDPPRPDDWGMVRRLSMLLTVPVITLESLSIDMTDGGTRTVKIVSQKINGTVNDGAFTFTVPKGAEIIDLR